MALLTIQQSGGQTGTAGSGTGKMQFYYSFAELKAVTTAVPNMNQYYFLLTKEYHLVYFVSDDTTSAEQLPNIVITSNGKRLKICGTEGF